MANRETRPLNIERLRAILLRKEENIIVVAANQPRFLT